jgi:hypothetical protein
MSLRNQSRIGAAAMVLLLLGTICAIRFGRHAAVSKNAGTAPPPQHPAVVASAKSLPATESSQWVRLSPDQVLATVNGSVIRLADILPLVNTNGADSVTLDKATLNYYLKRAVDRDLIFQKALQQGIALGEWQHQQLAAMQAMRNQPEPGGIARLNDSPAAKQLEMQDAEAFMLQTTLMSAQGDSPNVTEDQVAAYYTQHESQFGGISLDSLQKDQQSWQQVEVEIRNELAPSIRANYNNQVTGFMRNLEAQANITMTPLASL